MIIMMDDDDDDDNDNDNDNDNDDNVNDDNNDNDDNDNDDNDDNNDNGVPPPAMCTLGYSITLVYPPLAPLPFDFPPLLRLLKLSYN
jgi:hypothetical protein